MKRVLFQHRENAMSTLIAPAFKGRVMSRLAAVLALPLVFASTYSPAQQQDPARTIADELSPNFKPPVIAPLAAPDFEKRVLMIPMRDGVKL